MEITDKVMTAGGHQADLKANGRWAVSWLPGEWDRNAAITALLLAEAVQAGKTGPEVEAHAAELGLTMDQAAAMVTGR